MKWVIENWMWISVVGVPTLLAIGTYIASKTKTDKDDKFFAQANQIWKDLLAGITKVKSLPTPEEMKKQEDKKKK